ncbi:hypothetical protein [Agromyces atrinae]|uniref:Uncharacterized protein n=1 Tax=Agromyces atrinae TaxID=592376 RepID=A0A4Q2M4K7_9MICO|nr:hypothetical protein [Agromyces atrinae]NYD67399.1 hypothetical protein [Agromyces atrinae]RXZ86778.1 hypothetical protein ESP50_06845 [Agromyces atrinae]
MNDDNDLDPVARLRAADPAADVEPRAGFADDVIAQATAEAADDTAGVAAAGATVTDLGAERARRRPRWLPIAAVAASIAIVGGLGYGVGASTGGTTDLAGGAGDRSGAASAPITLQPATGGGPESGAASQLYDSRLAMPQAAVGYPDVLLPWGSGRTAFTGSGFSDSDGKALAFAYDSRSVSNVETIAALAAAFGVEGTPELIDGSWIVGPVDGSAPQLSVSLFDGTVSFGYSDLAINPGKCGDEAGVGVPCEPVGPIPDEDAAIDALRKVIADTGRDASTFEFTSETYEGAVTRSAQAWPVVNGQRLAQPWNLELSDAGIVGVSGSLAPLVELGDLPIISEQAAFERLSDPRFSAIMTPSAESLREQSAGMQTIEWVPPTEAPATPTSDVNISWPVTSVDLESVRLGLTTQWQPDGSVIVIPAYEFTDGAGSTWSIIAVADSRIDFSPLPRA